MSVSLVDMLTAITVLQAVSVQQVNSVHFVVCDVREMFTLLNDYADQL